MTLRSAGKWSAGGKGKAYAGTKGALETLLSTIGFLVDRAQGRIQQMPIRQSILGVAGPFITVGSTQA